MTRIVRIKNNSGSAKTYWNQTIEDGYYHTIDAADLFHWSDDENLLKDILDGYVVVNDGIADITSASTGIDWLKGIEPSRDADNHLIVAQAPLIATSTTLVTHNFCDPTTWYEQSVREDGGDGYGEVLTTSDNTTYASSHTNWIDLSHGKVMDEDEYNVGREVEVYVNGTLKTEDTDFTVDYAAGEVTFDPALTGGDTVKAIYNYENGSQFTIQPDANKRLKIVYVECQFGSSAKINHKHPICFDIWVYNPQDLPNKFKYATDRYKCITNIIDIANGGIHIPQFGNLQEDVVVMPFNYLAVKELRNSQGAELRVAIEGDVPLDGYYGTMTAYCLSEDD